MIEVIEAVAGAAFGVTIAQLLVKWIGLKATGWLWLVCALGVVLHSVL